MAGFTIEEVEGKVVFTAKIVPGSSKTCLAGLLESMIKVKVAAPPEKGKANKCLIDYLSRLLGVRKNAISIVSGQTSPVKQVSVTGISAPELLDKLGLSRGDAN